MKLIKNIIPAALCILLLADCKKKKKEEPPPDPTTTIEFVSITPASPKEYVDIIYVKIKYKDANGDLGDYSPDELSLYVKDARVLNPDKYHIKPLAPPSDKDIPIEGTVDLRLNSLFLLSTGPTELTTLTFKVKDRAGNWSNEVTSPQILISK